MPPTRKDSDSCPIHLSGGARIHTQSVTVDGWWMPAIHGNGAVLHNKQVVFYPSEPQFIMIVSSITTHMHLDPGILQYSSNFEENEHKQVMGYCEANTFLLSP